MGAGGCAGVDDVHSAGGVQGLASIRCGGFAGPAYLVRFSLIELWEFMGLLFGSVGMAEGDCGDIGGAAAPAREVGAPTRRADFSGELHRFIAIDSGHGWNYYFRACFVIITRLILPAVLNY